MSVHYVYKGNGGAKLMRPVLTREEYLSLRNGGEQKQLVAAIRGGDEGSKHRLVQMNYSCLPNDDGSLKGSKRMSTTVGMDVDHIPAAEMGAVKERILSRKAELGLLMLEESARGGGYHLVFRRRPELSQEENLKWASGLLDVAYDAQAKDITRVFFTTTEAELIYLDDAIFEKKTHPHPLPVREVRDMSDGEVSTPLPNREGQGVGLVFPTDYHGIPFKDIIAKYWEVNNRGFEPTKGDRDTLTYQLACDLRHICGRSFEWLDQVIPCYDGFPIEEKRAKIRSALASEFNGFPIRLRNTLNSLSPDPIPKGEGSEYTGGDLEDEQLSARSSQLSARKLPMGVKESIEAVGPQLAMPVVTAICPCIGTLATGVTLDVHGQKKGLNLIAYIARPSAPASARWPRA